MGVKEASGKYFQSNWEWLLFTVSFVFRKLAGCVDFFFKAKETKQKSRIQSLKAEDAVLGSRITKPASSFITPCSRIGNPEGKWSVAEINNTALDYSKLFIFSACLVCRLEDTLPSLSVEKTSLSL